MKNIQERKNPNHTQLGTDPIDWLPGSNDLIKLKKQKIHEKQ